MRRCRQDCLGAKGFAYFSVLWLVAFLAIGLLVAAEAYATAERRAREEQLLVIGREFAQAIRRYAEESAKLGQAMRYPAQLTDLVEDRRRPGSPIRHLRRIYLDPITGQPDWGQIRINGGIAAVHSLSAMQPLKIAGFEADEQHLDGRARYTEWIFGDTATLMAIPAKTVEMKK